MNCAQSLRSLLRLTATTALWAAALTAPLVEARGERQLSGPTTLGSKDRVSVILDREKGDDGTYVVLKVVVPQDVKIDAFMLPSPPRIVLDLDGASIKRSESYAVPANGVVKQVRLGAYPSKLRVVVDLTKAEAPKYDWKAGKRQVILRMLEDAATPQPPLQQVAKASEPPKDAAPTEKAAAVREIHSLPSETAPKLPAGDANSRDLPDATEPKSASLGESESADVMPAQGVAQAPAKVESVKIEKEVLAPPTSEKEQVKDVAEAGAAAGTLGAAAASSSSALPKQGLPVSGSLKIVGYRFEYTEPGKKPVLKITLNSDGAKAQISKVDATTYKIVVPKSSLANEDLVLPQFPPAEFVGFIMVMSEEVGESVEITISIEEGVSLTTLVHGDEIWVSPPGA